MRPEMVVPVTKEVSSCFDSSRAFVQAVDRMMSRILIQSMERDAHKFRFKETPWVDPMGMEAVEFGAVIDWDKIYEDVCGECGQDTFHFSPGGVHREW